MTGIHTLKRLDCTLIYIFPRAGRREIVLECCFERLGEVASLNGEGENGGSFLHMAFPVITCNYLESSQRADEESLRK